MLHNQELMGRIIDWRSRRIGMVVRVMAIVSCAVLCKKLERAGIPGRREAGIPAI